MLLSVLAVIIGLVILIVGAVVAVVWSGKSAGKSEEK